MNATDDSPVLGLDRPSPWLAPLAARVASVALVAITVGAFVRPFWLSDWYGNDEVDRYPGRLEFLHHHFSLFEPLPRWVPELAGGYGYPLFNFFNPGAMFVALPFRALGADPFAATKLALAVMLLVGGLHAMALGRRLWGEGAGVLAAVLTLTAPYTVSNFYHRGDFAEGWANLLFPVVLYHYVVLRENRRLGSFVALAFAWALLVPAHAFSALLFAIAFSILFSLRALHHRIEHARWNRGDGLVVLASTLGLSLAAIYWLPALGEKHSVRIDEFFSLDKLLRSVLHPADLFDPTPEGRIAAHRRLTLGAFIPALAAVALWKARRAQMPRRSLMVGFALGSVFALFMTTRLAEPIYAVVPLIGQILFPYRFLGLATLFAVLVAARAVVVFSPARREVAGLVLAGIALVATLPHLNHAAALDFPEGHADYVGRAADEAMLFDYGEYYPRSVVHVPPRAVRPFDVAGCEVRDAIIEPRRYELAVRAAETLPMDPSPDGAVAGPRAPSALEACSVTLSQFAWLGWAASLDGAPTPLEHDASGRMVVRLPAGEHSLVVAWTPTALQRGATWLSAAALAIWLALFGLALTRLRPTRWLARLRWLARSPTALPAALAPSHDLLEARAFRAGLERPEDLATLAADARALGERALVLAPAAVVAGRRRRRAMTAVVFLGLAGLAAYAHWPRPRLIASASSFLGGDPSFGAERAIDGLETTAWYEHEAGGWLEIALVPPRAVSSIELLNTVGLDAAPRSTEGFRLQLALEGEVLGELVGRLEAGERREVELAAPKVDRVRFEVQSHRGPGGGLVELRVR